MTSLSDDVDELYSPSCAGPVRNILRAIDAGDLTAATEGIAALGPGREENYARAHCGFILALLDGRHADAEAALAACIDRNPPIFLTHYCLLLMELSEEERAIATLNAQLAAGREPAVREALEALVAATPESESLREFQAELLVRLGRHEEALQAALKMPDRRLTRLAYAFAEMTESTSVPADAEASLCRILESPEFFAPRLSRITAALMADRLARWKRDEASLEAISEDALCHALLRHTEFYRADVELGLTALRRRILLDHADSIDRPSACLPLILSLAMQCWRNEYVYYVQSDEAAIVDRLAGAIGTSTGRSALMPLMLVILYRSPLSLPGLNPQLRASLARYSPAAAGWLARLIDHEARERELADQFAQQSALHDKTSREVADMYESNPYPRWTGSVPYSNPERKTPPELAGLGVSPGWRPLEAPEIRSMLIAGCGSGQHPLMMAGNFPSVEITAIDISCRSLAYAQIMADRLATPNVVFERRDILSLPDWGRQFDMIEAIGVIHHMRDPEAGLQALLACLRSKGLLTLGVYSRRARAGVIAFRESQSPAAAADPNEVRRLRHEILMAPDQPGHAELVRVKDFYSMTGCRDLLFHVQESQFTLPQLGDLLERNRLRFIRFDEKYLPGSSASLLRPGANPFRLDSWIEAEQRMPTLFGGMYVLYAQRMD